jgi:dUTPase
MIEEGEKITQFIEEKVLISELVEVPIEELYEGESQRGAGAFGSTGTK